MKKTIQIIVFVLVLFTLIIGCNKDDDIIISKDPEQKEDPKVPDSGDAPLTDVSIVVPNGSSLDFSKTKLHSYFKEFDVQASGSSQAILNKDGRTLTLLLDTDKNILLMGFVSDSINELSVRSTLEASFYLGLGTMYLPNEVKDKYFENFNTLPGLDELVSESTSMFAKDHRYFGSEGFQKIIEQRINALRDGKNIVDITSRIYADGSDIRSGIQLREDDMFSFSLINNYRRRSYGFVYKKRITDINNGINNLYTNIISENPDPFKEVKINSPQAIREVLGVVADYGSGTGLNFARTEAGPITLEIGEGEKEVLYTCRVIGPSLGPWPKDLLNKKEYDKLNELIYETFAYELVLPIFLDIAGHTKVLDGLEARDSKFTGFVNQLQIIAASVPAVDGALKEGEYQVALSEFLRSYYNNLLGANATDLIKALLDGVTAAGIQNNPGYFIQNSPKAAEISDGVGKYLERADMLLKLVDYSRILYAHGNSEYLEEWEVPVTLSKVTLIPSEALAIQSEQKRFEVIIEDSNLPSGHSYEYRYSTTGKYGVLRDAAISGKEGTEIVSSQKEVIYFSSSSVDLPDDAEDKIYVDVYIKQGSTYTKVNSEAAEAKVKIKPLGFEISPDGISLKGGTNLTLSLKQTDGKDPLDNTTQDYRIVWDTPAKFGLFNGSQSTITKINDTKVIYEALEKEREGKETVYASIYSRRKGTADQFQFLDKVAATVKIENDDNIIVFYVPIVLRERVWHPVTGGIHFESGYYFAPIAPPPNKDIVQYTVTAIEFLQNGQDYTSRCGSKTYKPGNEAQDLNEDGNYSLVCGTTQTTSEIDYVRIRGFKRQGFAQVAVLLRPKI